MEIKIFSVWKAAEYQPINSTYAIRIFPSDTFSNSLPPLIDSPLYRKIMEYTFDDNDIHPFLQERGPVWFNENIAEKIIKDFVESKDEIETLLVHCSVGKNRSPAVALSLNEIFGLGADSNALKTRYEHYNRFVYEMMVEIGSRK